MAGGINALANLQGKVDSNNALVVSLAGGSFGSDTQVLFNDAGTIAGDAGLTYNRTTDALTVGLILAGNGTVGAPSLSFAAAPTTGIWYAGASGMQLVFGAVYGLAVSASAVTANRTIDFETDNGFDVGSASFRGRTGRFGTSVEVPTVYGSTAANGDLILQGTSNATKATSDVAIQPTGGTISTGGTACVAAFGPAVVVSITVKNGLITAIS